MSQTRIPQGRPGQVVIVPRQPSGRTRSGGGFIGRWKRGAGRKPLNFSLRDREVAEWLAGPDWKTYGEIAAATGIHETLLRPLLARIRYSGSPEYTLLSRRTIRQDRGLAGEPAGRRHTEYRVEKKGQVDGDDCESIGS